MKRNFAIAAACACVLPGATLAASRAYEVQAFDVVSVAAGVEADISLGATRSVRADTKSDNFDALLISVKDNVLRIERPARSWFSGWFGTRPSYQVHVVTPALRALSASSGAEVTAKGSLPGDFTVTASSGSDIEVSLINGGNVKARASSGSEISLAGKCVSLDAEASSGSDLDAGELRCENAALRASSGSDISVNATKSVAGRASSGSDVRVRGKPPAVQVEKSSGADVVVRD